MAAINESLNQKMTALADEVRELSGATEPLGIDAMTTNISDANDEVSTQVDLISQLATALEGKSSVTPSLQNKTVTPTTTTQTVIADDGYDGLRAVTVLGDENLVPENIAEGVSIFGVEGNHSGGGSDIETCTVQLSCGTSSSNISGSFPKISYTGVKNDELIISELSNVASPHTISDVAKNTLLFCSSNGNESIINGGITEISSTFGYICMSVTGDGSAHFFTCYIKGTKISLANGSVKEVQDITYGDELLVWNFDKGCYDIAKPLWIKKVETADYYYHCVLENDIELDLVGSNGNCHAVYCVDDNRFEYANNCVGKRVMTEKGVAKLLSCDKVEGMIEFYNIATDYHINCYANNVLTSTKLNNIYPMENMKFIKEDREIIPYDEFDGIPIEFYIGFRLGEHKLEDIDTIKHNVLQKISNMLPKS